MVRHPNMRDRMKVQQWAREMFALPNFYVLDTETTGFGKADEIVQIGIIDKHGETVLNTLVKPTIPVPLGAYEVHGIRDEMLQDAPTFADVYALLSMKIAGSHVVAYNMDFDWRMVQQNCTLYKLPLVRTGKRHCAMKHYAAYRGVRGRKGYKWHKLSTAAAYEKIEVVDAHSALGDVRMTLKLMEKMAESA